MRRVRAPAARAAPRRGNRQSAWFALPLVSLPGRESRKLTVEARVEKNRMSRMSQANGVAHFARIGAAYVASPQRISNAPPLTRRVRRSGVGAALVFRSGMWAKSLAGLYAVPKTFTALLTM